MQASIKITQRMLNKSIIDANKSVVAFAKEYLPIDYDQIENGQKVTYRGFFTDDFRSTASEIRLYKLLSIKHLSKWAKAGDTVVFKHDPTINPRSISNDCPIRMNVRKGEAA
ncbi:MAG: hypothetical protein ACO21T_12985 [Alphaproteobacteria bacterium]